MKSLNFTRCLAGPVWMLRALARMGWPRQLAVALLTMASICLMGVGLIDRQTQDLRAQLELAQQPKLSLSAGQAAVIDTLSIAPDDAQYIKDLELLFRIGLESGVGMGSIDYKSDVNTKANLALRTVDLRVNEDYPKIKGFISRVLRQMPHVALQEIRIDRKDAQTIQGSMLLKFALVYQTSAKTKALN